MTWLAEKHVRSRREAREAVTSASPLRVGQPITRRPARLRVGFSCIVILFNSVLEGGSVLVRNMDRSVNQSKCRQSRGRTNQPASNDAKPSTILLIFLVPLMRLLY